MHLTPQIIEFDGIRLLGIRSRASFSSDITPGLWARFRAKIHTPYRDGFGDELYSVSDYPPGFFDAVDPERGFDKWTAAVYLPDAKPDGISEWLLIPPGLYAVFEYQGKAADGADFFRAIHTEWLPQSDYQLDFRPHFEILPPGYDRHDPHSSEDVYIPIKRG